MASVVGRGGAASSVEALEDVEAEDDEDILREVPPGLGRVVAAKGRKGPGVEKYRLEHKAVKVW